MPLIKQETSPHSLTKALILAIFPSFFGILGLHRLYTRRFCSGIFMLLTSLSFISSLVCLITLIATSTPQAVYTSFWGLSLMFLAPLEVIAALMYFYDVIILISLRFKDSEDKLVLSPQFTFMSPHSFAITMFLTLNGGWLGLHRIYIGRKKTGILMFLSGVINLCLLFFAIFLFIGGMPIMGSIFIFIPLLHLIWWIEDLLHVMQFKLHDERSLPVCRN